MKFSPFRVSFDGPLPRGEQWRARIMAASFGGAALLIGSGGMSALLNASSGMLAAWSNGTLAQEVGTTGVASRVEPARSGTALQPAPPTEAAAPMQAAKVASPSHELRKPQPKAKAKSVRRAQSKQLRENEEFRRTRADARTERRWNERATEIGRRSPRNDPFGPFR